MRFLAIGHIVPLKEERDRSHYVMVYGETYHLYAFEGMDGWMNGVLGHFYALSRLNWAGDNLG